MTLFDVLKKSLTLMMMKKQDLFIKPLVVIIGATGCGKTKLSIELAKHFNGEIISADSMQMYKGLDLATNKATIEERLEVPHHLIDMIDPLKQFTVLDFQKLALNSIESILSRQKFPIIAGGTNYYIESILWDTLVGSKLIGEFEGDLINDDEPAKQLPEIKTIDDLMQNKIYYRNLKSVSDQKLHDFLTEIDPRSAKILNVHNRRKVIRCLQVFQQAGKPMAQVLEEQRSKGSRHGGPLRFKNSIILWLDCQKTVLNARLDDRVDKMIKQGLIEELTQFHRDYNALRFEQNRTADYTEGIFQAIGFKEFHQYLLLSEEQRQTDQGKKKLEQGIRLLKQRTKSYVTKQLKWVRRRFLCDSTVRQVPNIYRLDTTDTNQWNSNVLDISVYIVENTLKAFDLHKQSDKQKIWDEILNPLKARIEKSEQDDTEDDLFISGQFECPVCKITCSGGKSFKEHLASKKHWYNQNKSKNSNVAEQKPL